MTIKKIVLFISFVLFFYMQTASAQDAVVSQPPVRKLPNVLKFGAQVLSGCINEAQARHKLTIAWSETPFHHFEPNSIVNNRAEVIDTAANYTMPDGRVVETKTQCFYNLASNKVENIIATPTGH